MAEDQQERTERGSQKRRERARERGNVPRSREITSAAIVLASALFLFFGSPLLVSRMKGFMAGIWSASFAAPLTAEGFSILMNGVVFEGLKMIGPAMLFFGLVGVVSIVGQTGLVWSEVPFTPDWSRINPLSGFKRLFALHLSTAELLKGMIKLTIIGWISWRLIQKDIPPIVEAVDSAPERILALSVGFALRLAGWIGVAVAFLSAGDYLFQRWNYERSIRMTKQELKEEAKESEVNPRVKSKIRSIQRSLARARMMADVPRADVVITNPTHLAVALMYRSDTMGAPVVVAKGAGVVAEKIREIARSNQVPVLENKPLARSLFKEVEIGFPIPSNLYKAVAEILAYVYRLRGRDSLKAGGSRR